MNHEPSDQVLPSPAEQMESSSHIGGRGRPGFDGDDQAKMQRLAQEAQQMRHTFGRARAAYNARVCDMLAAAGMQPTANLCLKVGRWGTNGDVQADVRAWYAALSKDKSDHELNVPPAARRQALDLIEQLFALANQAAQVRLEERLAPLQQAEAEAQAAAEHLRHELASTEHAARIQAEQAREEAVEAQRQREKLQAELTHLQAEIDASKERQRALERLLAQVREDALTKERGLEREISALKEAAAQAQAAAAQQLLQAQQAAEADRRALMLRSDQERQEQAALTKSLTSELSDSRQRIDVLSAQVSSLTMDLTLVRADCSAARMEAKRLNSSEHRAASLESVVEVMRGAGLAITLPEPVLPAGKGAKKGQEPSEAELAQARAQASSRIQAALQEWVGAPSLQLERVVRSIAPGQPST